MANEAQYINPLIESMAQGFANKREQDRLKAQTAQYGVENKQKQQALDRLQDQLQKENEFRQKMIDLEAERQKNATQQANDIHSLHLQNLAANGVISKDTSGDQVGLGPGNGGIGAGMPASVLSAPQSSQANQPGFNFEGMQGGNGPTPQVQDVLSNLNQNGVTPQQLGGGTLTSQPPPGVPPPPQPVQAPNQQLHPAEQSLQQTGGLTDGKYIYPGPERKAQIERLNAAAQSGGAAQGQEPFKIEQEKRAHENQLAVVDQLHQNDMEKDRQHMAEEHSNQLLLEQERRKTRAMVAGITGLDPDDPTAGTVHQQYETMANSVLSGNQDFSKLKPDDQKRLRNLYPSYQWPSDGKSYKATLDNYDKTNELIDEQRRLAVNYSSDSPTSPSIGGHDAFGYLNDFKSKFPQSEIGNALQTFNGHSGNLAKEIDSATAGRRPEAEVKRVTAGSFDPSRPMSQNLQKTKDLENLRDVNISSALKGVPPEQRARVLSLRGISDPGQSGSGKATVTGNIVNIPGLGLHVAKDAATAQAAADEFNARQGGQQ